MYPAPEEGNARGVGAGEDGAEGELDHGEFAGEAPRPWWEREGFASLDDAIGEMTRDLDERERRESGEALVTPDLPGRERELLPDPRYGRTLARVYQVNIKLNFFERNELRSLARDCVLPPSTLARMLVIRGVRASRRSFELDDRQRQQRLD